MTHGIGPSYITSLVLTAGTSSPTLFTVPQGATVILNAMNSNLRIAYEAADITDARRYFTLIAGGGGVAGGQIVLPPGTFNATSGQLWAADEGSPAILQVWVIQR